MTAYRMFLLVTLSASITTSALAGDEEADKKLIKRIFFEVDLVPSLYALEEKPLKFGSLPKFTAAKLTDYSFGKKEIYAKDRDIWKENKERYVKDFPLRAAIFEAADENDTLKRLEIAMTIPAAEFSPKDRAAFQEKQANLGAVIFKQKCVLKQMQEAAEKRDQEKSKRWQATFDLAMTRTHGNLLFLYEYSYALGQIRADKLPELGKEHDGWTIAFQQKINIPEGAAKDVAKTRLKLLESIQKQHAGTPWAYFAERDGKRDMGMAWAAKKK
jgi:hypothetical protein